MMETKFYIEPEEPVMNEAELINEMIQWAQREARELEILSTGGNVIVRIDGKKYRPKLEVPKRILTKMGFPFGRGMLGYKCIYFYEV